MARLSKVRRTVGCLRDPSYTGGDRCRPCTVFNLAVAAILAAGIGVTLGSTARRELAVSALAFAGACVAIYLRGYLVPGTPTLAGRHHSDRTLEPFRSHNPVGHDGASDPAPVFRELGVVREDSSGSGFVLSPGFERAWFDAVDEFAANADELRTQLSSMAGLDPNAVALQRRARSFDAYHDGELLARWESKAACQADVAAATIFPLFDSRWGRRTPEERTKLLGSIRQFLDRCPTCRDRVSLSSEVVESYCRRQNVVAATCEGCTARLFEIALDSERHAAADAPPPRNEN